MESSNAGNLQFSLCFDEFDAFAEATREWDLDFFQLDCGSFQAELSQTITPSVILVECAFSRMIEQHGAPPPGYRTFGFAASQNLELRWRGKTVGPDSLMLFPPGCELESISRPGFHVFAFSVLERVLEANAARRGFDSVEDLFPAGDLISCPAEIMANIRFLALSLSRSAEIRPDLLDDCAFRENLELDLVDSVLDAIATAGGTAACRSTAHSRTRAVKMALDIIADRADEPVTVAEIARSTGVTDRTLRNAFEDVYALSPKQYLQAYRLNQVHRQLLRFQETGQNVSDSANAWGFWHMGQFARDYRRMFGVLPSESMKKG
jgi:AraC family ethanolamine operon transcriptional activator